MQIKEIQMGCELILNIKWELFGNTGTFDMKYKTLY